MGVAKIENMDIIHMSEADVVKDIAIVLERVQQGSEIIIKRGNDAVAVIRPPQAAGRMISDVIADLEARGSDSVIDDDFAHDIEEGLKAQRQPWNPPSWG